MGGTWPFSGIPPTGVMGRVDAVTGLRVSDFDTSRRFYGVVFGALGIAESTVDTGTWGELLAIRAESPATANADLFIAAASSTQLQQVADALKQANLDDGLEWGETTQANRTVSWVTFPDPDRNLVWVAYGSPVFPPRGDAE